MHTFNMYRQLSLRRVKLTTIIALTVLVTYRLTHPSGHSHPMDKITTNIPSTHDESLSNGDSASNRSPNVQEIRNCISRKMLRTIQYPYTTIDIGKYGNLTNKLEDPLERQTSFSRIFQKRAWRAKVEPGFEDIQASGPGSILNTTRQVVFALSAIIEILKRELNKEVITFLDLPCGDILWMSGFLEKRTDVEYTGMDIVPNLIRRHRDHYRDKPWKFRHHDIVHSELNESFDLILCRHMTMHLRHADTLRALQHFSTSGSKYLLVTDFPLLGRAREVNTRERTRWRRQNLSLDPYRIAPPLCSVPDYRKGMWLNLYHLPLLQIPSCNRTLLKKNTGKMFPCV